MKPKINYENLKERNKDIIDFCMTNIQCITSKATHY
jgi:hypothetical protein